MKKNLEIKIILMGLWLFQMLSILFRDIHQLVHPGFIEDLMAGKMLGYVATEELMFWGAFVALTPILMMLLSVVLTVKWNRRLNVVAAVPILFMFATSFPTDLDDYVFWIAEILSALLIIGISIMWPKIRKKLETRGE